MTAKGFAMSDVLIVEDDPVLREALAETMNLAGHSYLAAKDGKEALAMLERHSPAIVLTDIRMDKMEGQQLLAEIQRRNPGVPVILMTAHGSVKMLLPLCVMALLIICKNLLVPMH